MVVDLRSDTITKPTQEMLDAMVSAPLGDDVLGDDPTVHALEKLAAEKMGKEAAVFVPSGTMANQISIRSWTEPGDAILIEQDAHALYYESGAPGVISGVITWTLPSRHGAMDPNQIEERITKGSLHTPATRLLCIENTHNRAGGTVIPMDMMQEYQKICKTHQLKLHLDGARIFNAAVYLGIEAKEIAQYADSVSFCLSKGLSCPVGSLVTGPKEFIQKARQHRKRLGGVMRQAGLLAAAGIYALNNLVERLAEDHRRARAFAEFASQFPSLCVDLDTVQTNIVRMNTHADSVALQHKLESHGIRCFSTGNHQLRFVFHREITDEGLLKAKEIMAKVFG